MEMDSLTITASPEKLIELVELLDTAGMRVETFRMTNCGCCGPVTDGHKTMCRPCIEKMLPSDTHARTIRDLFLFGRVSSVFMEGTCEVCEKTF